MKSLHNYSWGYFSLDWKGEMLFMFEKIIEIYSQEAEYNIHFHLEKNKFLVPLGIINGDKWWDTH